jgi:hypothetical protein
MEGEGVKRGISLSFQQLKEQTKEHQVCVKRIQLREEEEPEVSYSVEDSNRIIQYLGKGAEDRFLLLDIFLEGKRTKEILLQGIEVNGVLYRFFGYSANQLKRRTCWMFDGSNEEIEKLITQLGNFNKSNTASKRAARIGLLFSGCVPTIHIPNCK